MSTTIYFENENILLETQNVEAVEVCIDDLGAEFILWAIQQAVYTAAQRAGAGKSGEAKKMAVEKKFKELCAGKLPGKRQKAVKGEDGLLPFIADELRTKAKAKGVSRLALSGAKTRIDAFAEYERATKTLLSKEEIEKILRRAQETLDEVS